jgi:hypothetical protein
MMVRDFEPPVLVDHERWERNQLFTEGQKQKKDETKRKRDEGIHMREALEKRQRQQARDGLPREESPSKPETDGDNSKTSSDEKVEA